MDSYLNEKEADDNPGALKINVELDSPNTQKLLNSQKIEHESYPFFRDVSVQKTTFLVYAREVLSTRDSTSYLSWPQALFLLSF